MKSKKELLAAKEEIDKKLAAFAEAEKSKSASPADLEEDTQVTEVSVEAEKSESEKSFIDKLKEFFSGKDGTPAKEDPEAESEESITINKSELEKIVSELAEKLTNEKLKEALPKQGVAKKRQDEMERLVQPEFIEFVDQQSKKSGLSIEAFLEANPQYKKLGNPSKTGGAAKKQGGELPQDKKKRYERLKSKGVF